MLLALLRVALQRQGFTVWTAEGGRAGLDLFAQQQQRIGLVLLDVRMPDLDGPQTLAELQRLRPALVCCFMSGHTGTYSPQDLLARGARYLFDKPFRLEEVISVLWRLAQESPKQAV
jgi:DNA-binding response OmpR family regulator